MHHVGVEKEQKLIERGVLGADGDLAAAVEQLGTKGDLGRAHHRNL
jgi:hypothetical protein